MARRLPEEPRRSARHQHHGRGRSGEKIRNCRTRQRLGADRQLTDSGSLSASRQDLRGQTDGKGACGSRNSRCLFDSCKRRRGGDRESADDDAGHDPANRDVAGSGRLPRQRRGKRNPRRLRHGRHDGGKIHPALGQRIHAQREQMERGGLLGARTEPSRDAGSAAHVRGGVPECHDAGRAWGFRGRPDRQRRTAVGIHPRYWGGKTEGAGQTGGR